MKILITTDLFTVETNGVVTSVKNLSGELETRGHEVKILTLSEGFRSHKKDNVYYIRSAPVEVYPDVRMPLSYRHKYIKELVDWNPDVIHSQCEFFSYFFAEYISKKTSAPIVHTYHTLYEQYASYVVPSKRLGNWVVKKASKKRLKSAKTIIAPTKKVEIALRGYEIDKDIRVVPSGISLEQHKNRITDEVRIARRKALGISKDDIVLINLGRLGTEKNLDELICFFKTIAADHKDLKMMLVGGGPAKDDLMKTAEKLEISDRIIFTGMVKPDEVYVYYQLGDIFVNASTSETQGLTYIEASANGLPLVCRNDPCLSGVLLHGENGYLYNNEEEFTSYIISLAYDSEKRHTFGVRSEEIAQLFDKKSFGQAVEAIYDSLAK